LKPLSVDIPANSISKFFQKDIEFKESDIMVRNGKRNGIMSSTDAVIDLGSETTIVNILKNKIPEFNRVVLQGSSNIDQAIMDHINLEKSQLDKAERYKKMYGIVTYKDPNNDLEWQVKKLKKNNRRNSDEHKKCLTFI
jgi:type IV pilus assembly protein PilM